jgi:hypothetical protein
MDNMLYLLFVLIPWIALLAFCLISVTQLQQVESLTTLSSWSSTARMQIDGLNVVSSSRRPPPSSLFSFDSRQPPSFQEQTKQRPTINDDGEHHYHDTRNELFLLSLKWTPDEQISTDVRALWKWKDSTLGDGRDFFVPKPKTLKKLQDYLLKYCTGLKECSILSNCARLDVLCTISTTTTQEQSSPSPTTTSTNSNNVIALSFEDDTRRGIERPSVEQQQEQLLLDNVSLCFASQMLYAGSNPPSMLSQLLFPTQMDRPDAVLNLDRPPADAVSYSKEGSYVLYNVQKELSTHWEIIRGPNAVLRYLCEVSAGMATRPRRPDRTTQFQPFSSRDAHILLQLKRTKEIVSVSQQEESYNSDKSRDKGLTMVAKSIVRDRHRQQLVVIPLLFEYALRAGKAARNPDIVPELNFLREDVLYGVSSSAIVIVPPSSPVSPINPSSAGAEAALSDESSNHGSIGIVNGGNMVDRMTELERSRHVAAIAQIKAIEPLVQECMGKFLMDNTRRKETIANLRARTLEMAASSSLVVDGRGETRAVDEVELLWLKRKLHQPTMELRKEGRLVSFSNVDSFLEAISIELNDLRKMRATGDVMALKESD